METDRGASQTDRLQLIEEGEPSLKTEAKVIIDRGAFGSTEITTNEEVVRPETNVQAVSWRRKRWMERDAGRFVSTRWGETRAAKHRFPHRFGA